MAYLPLLIYVLWGSGRAQMDFDKVNRWLTLVANIGVVAGIVFLAIEIKQNTEVVRAQTRSGITESVLTLLQMERDSRLVATYAKQEHGEDLTFEERFLLDNMANAKFRHWENSYYQRRAGLFDEDQYNAETVTIWQSMQMQDHVDHWEANREMYSKQFRDFVDNVKQRESN